MKHEVIDSKEVVILENARGKIYTQKRTDGSLYLVAEHTASGLFSCLKVGADNNAVGHLELVSDGAYFAKNKCHDSELAYFWEPLFIGKQNRKSAFIYNVETIDWEGTSLAHYAKYGDFSLFVLYAKDTAFFVPLVYNLEVNGENDHDSNDFCLFYLLMCNIIAGKAVNVENDSASSPLCVSDVVGDFLAEKKEITKEMKKHKIICNCADYLDD